MDFQLNAIPQDTSTEAMVAAIETNVFDFYPLLNHWPRAEVHFEPELLWTITSIPIPLFNSVLRARLKPEQVDTAIEAAIERCRARDVPMLWYTGPSTQPPDLGKYLIAHGFVYEGDTPGMALDLESLEGDLAAPPGLTIEQVQDVDSLEKWCQVAAEGFEFPEYATEAYFDFLSCLGFGEQTIFQHYLGWLDGAAVAISSCLLGSDSAGIYNVTTLPRARRRGIGAAMTRLPLEKARASGYRIGVLNSSDIGFGVYRQLGFHEYCKIGNYAWSAAPGR